MKTETQEKLDALGHALEQMEFTKPVVRVTVLRVRQIEEVDEYGKRYLALERDDLGIGDEALVIIEGPPITVKRGGEATGTQPKVVKFFSLELLEDLSPKELAQQIAPDMRQKFESMPDVPDWADAL